MKVDVAGVEAFVGELKHGGSDGCSDADSADLRALCKSLSRALGVYIAVVIGE